MIARRQSDHDRRAIDAERGAQSAAGRLVRPQHRCVVPVRNVLPAVRAVADILVELAADTRVGYYRLGQCREAAQSRAYDGEAFHVRAADIPSQTGRIAKPGCDQT